MGNPNTQEKTPFERRFAQRTNLEEAALDAAMRQMAQAIVGPGDSGVELVDALGQIGSFYGVPVGDYPSRQTANRDDALAYLDQTAEKVLGAAGIQHRKVLLQSGWYQDAAGAMLAATEDGEPIALIPGASGYTFLDPKTGRRERVTSRNAGSFGSAAFCFYRPLPLRQLTLRDLVVYMVRGFETRDVVLILAALAFSTLLGMLLPAANAALFGPVLASNNSGILVNAFVMLACVGIAQAIIAAAKTLVMSGVGSKIALQVQAAAMMRMLSLPASFFRNHASGELQSLLGGFVTVVGQIQKAVLGAALSTVFSLAYLAQIFAIAPALGVPAVVIVLANLTVSITVTLIQLRVSRKQIRLKAELGGWQSAILNSVRAIRVFGAEKRAYATWAQRYGASAKLTYNGPVLVRMASAIQLGVSLLGTAAIYCSSFAAGISVGQYMAFASAFGMVMGAFMGLASTVGSIAQIKPQLDMLRPILEAVPESGEGKTVLANPTGKIELSDVTFGYDPGKPVLSGFSLTVNPGDYVALVGGSGSGKSTVMRLMLGFETPQCGTVCYDGHDLGQLDVQALRRNIGVVLQQTQLFKGDIFSNITISAPWLSEEDAWAAAEGAGIADDLRALPMGMSTVVAEGGAGFSGGQKQRLAIARALAPRPTILMFDEATSALDNKTQQMVSDTLDTLNCTRVVIAHRISTIRNCNRICMLQGGRIVEEGTYDELMARRGAFYELVHRQEL